MGMMIDDFYWSKKYEKLLSDYKTRLKADMVAMLEVIKLRIDSLPEPLNRDRVNYCIQEKINKLKEAD